MRRSVREAIVGFSLLAALASAAGLSLWLRGISLNRSNWTVRASFAQASGLAERSAVTYRGVQVGNVRRVRVTPGAVIADLEISKADLHLAKPAYAEISSASLLGGDSQVSLVSTGPLLPPNAPAPYSKTCNQAVMLCNGSSIVGLEAASLSTVTALMHKMLTEVDKDNLISKFSKLTTSFEQTSQDASGFLKDGQVLVKKLDKSVDHAQPTITNLNASTAHLRNLLVALDNPKTVKDLQQTVSNAEKLSAKWNAVGGDVKKLTDDPKFMDGVRSVAVGLGKFFDELYPERKVKTY
ncbi:MlaD family protein [Cyanobium sp. WAJ14-Wanaka]|uniref:MlaD family protein n=1 Tax=Cyanobium sp. WAJ14-Wanaka TaxID=2823725 RepID=UPI0020CBA76D|nr:MlaD family protein [Cyanobium sp. WAJ14-Wanaka]MCP9775791.1 MCE family protein [Cyanobium sp. WAJ14-Wanaka]